MQNALVLLAFLLFPFVFVEKGDISCTAPRCIVFLRLSIAVIDGTKERRILQNKGFLCLSCAIFFGRGEEETTERC